MRIYQVCFALLVLFHGAATAADSPEQLAQELGTAVRSADAGKLSEVLSAGTQRMMAEVQAAASRLSAAKSEALAAIDKRFDLVKWPDPAGNIDLRRGFARMSDVEIVNIESIAPDRAMLHVKTTIKDSRKPGRVEENVVPAIMENGGWKIDLSELARSQIEIANRQAARFSELTEGINSGKLSDRISAFISAMNAASATGTGGRR